MQDNGVAAERDDGLPGTGAEENSIIGGMIMREEILIYMILTIFVISGLIILLSIAQTSDYDTCLRFGMIYNTTDLCRPPFMILRVW